ncbi:MAG: hypothetical protein DIAAKJNI_00239 [Candidatus Argoarchaeum ethanivorans]|uniref:Uncharacterized protein n=1 Tax=Candidatus Argoarchaeum ethanivorans TaxID=2608793 RepID=A0A811T766_9EURY|nr:MAG: hypothetical protein DIAAKJNI_00239 [Candidatus Argoarchaeum ethanivorans]
MSVMIQKHLINRNEMRYLKNKHPDGGVEA